MIFEQEIKFSEVMTAFENAKNDFANTEIEISPLDIFRRENAKTISIRFKIIPLEKTLTGDEITQIMNKMTKIAENLGGKVA